MRGPVLFSTHSAAVNRLPRPAANATQADHDDFQPGPRLTDERVRHGFGYGTQNKEQKKIPESIHLLFTLGPFSLSLIILLVCLVVCFCLFPFGGFMPCGAITTTTTTTTEQCHLEAAIHIDIDDDTEKLRSG